MLDKQYKKELDWKQKFSKDIGEFRKKAYESENLMPKRYCLVLTNLCNLACDFCFQIRTKQKNSLNSDDWINLIKQLPDNSRITLTGGEPLVIKNFEEIFKETVKRHECNLICNGLLLTKEIIDLLNDVRVKQQQTRVLFAELGPDQGPAGKPRAGAGHE